MALFYCPIVYGYQSLNDYRKFLIQQKNGVVNKNFGFFPKHLKLFACGKPSRNSSDKPCEGYRIPRTKKITQTTNGG